MHLRHNDVGAKFEFLSARAYFRGAVLHEPLIDGAARLWDE